MCVNWQHIVGGDASRVGQVGARATPPGNYQGTAGQDIIVVEVYYSYTPLMKLANGVLSVLSGASGTADTVVLYKTALYKPRQGTLTTITP
jgi:hypothetical protein